MPTPETVRVPDEVSGCRDAEDYFQLLGVAYDERVLAFGRLHVLRLFQRELAVAGGAPDLAGCRDALERAYAALLAAGPLGHRVFKVLADAAPGQFVPEGDLVVEEAGG